MSKVYRFNSIPRNVGVGVYLPASPNFCHKIRTAIDFSQTFLTFSFYGQLKHDIRSLRYVFRCFVEGR